MKKFYLNIESDIDKLIFTYKNKVIVIVNINVKKRNAPLRTNLISIISQITIFSNYWYSTKIDKYWKRARYEY